MISDGQPRPRTGYFRQYLYLFNSQGFALRSVSGLRLSSACMFEAISQTLSDTSTLTVHSDGFNQLVLDCIEEDVPIDMRIRQAKGRISYLNGHAPSQRMIPNTEIDSHRVLEAMLEHAPTGRGKYYTACAIFCCREDVKEFVNLANDWVKFLLWLCITRDTFSIHLDLTHRFL